MNFIKGILAVLESINISCEDDKNGFKDLHKINIIDTLLQESKFVRIHSGKLAIIYSQMPVHELSEKPLILVSSHIDTVYRSFYDVEGKDVIVGTLDNSITNAVIIFLMQSKSIPKNVIIAFTGNEEKDSFGVDETISFLNSVSANVEMVINTDVTAVGYKSHSYTVESYFIRKGKGRIFERKKELKDYIIGTLENLETKTIHHDKADPDDTWQFDEHNHNCFSFCIPVKGVALHSDWMHDDAGIIVKKSSLEAYSPALLKLMEQFSKDLT